MSSIALQLAGMKCTACIDHVDRALCSVDGVQATDVKLEPQQALVTYDHRLTTPQQLCDVIIANGFQVLRWEEHGDTQPPHWESDLGTPARNRVLASADRDGQQETKTGPAVGTSHTRGLQSEFGDRAAIDRNLRRYWQVDGMHCSSCVSRVERAMASLPDVHDVRVNLATHRASAQLAPEAPADGVLKAIARAGYQATPLAPTDQGISGGAESIQREVASWRNRAAFACLGLGLLLSCTWLLSSGRATGWILAAIATGLLG